MEIIISDQLDDDGKVIDKIATIKTIGIIKTVTKYKTELLKDKKKLEIELVELNEILEKFE